MIKLKNIISEIITEYEKGETLTFEHGCVDSYRGQNYCNLVARDKDGKFVGSIAFSTYENQIHISMMHTKKTERRKGIATAMAKELQKEYPNNEIIWGMTTSYGTKFLKKLPKKFKSGQWRVNVNEMMSPHGQAKDANKRRGYIGVVYRGTVEAYDEMVPDVMAIDHSEFPHGRRGSSSAGTRWRYFLEQPNNVVLWNERPFDDDRYKVEDWLAKKGIHHPKHIDTTEYINRYLQKPK